MRLQRGYAELSEEEMEYDGSGGILGDILAIAGILFGVASIATLNPIAVAGGVASIASGVMALTEAHPAGTQKIIDFLTRLWTGSADPSNPNNLVNNGRPQIPNW
jgi:hypothetical protein